MTKEQLHKLIDDAIYNNDKGKITGDILNDVLSQIVDNLQTTVDSKLTTPNKNIVNSINSIYSIASNAQPKETGKGLSTNDFSNEYKEKIDNIESGIKTIDGGSGEVQLELEPNKYYIFGEVTSLTLTLGTEIPGILNEYMFEFSTGSAPAVLNLPEEIKWIGSKEIGTDKRYQVSIVNNIAVMGGAA